METSVVRRVCGYPSICSPPVSPSNQEPYNRGNSGESSHTANDTTDYSAGV